MSEKHPEQTKHLFGDSYQGYELPDGSYVPGARHAPDPRPIWGWMSRLVPGPLTHEEWSWEGKHVLDLAGNNGYHGLRALREGAASATLLELHPGACAKATEIAAAWGLPLKVKRGSIEDRPWDKREKFDAIFAHQVLYHLERPIHLLRRIRGALNDGGFFAAHSRIAIHVHEKHWEWVPTLHTMEETLRYVRFGKVHFGGDRIALNEVRRRNPPDETGQRKVMVVAHTR